MCLRIDIGYIHLFIGVIFPNKPSILGYPHDYGNPHKYMPIFFVAINSGMQRSTISYQAAAHSDPVHWLRSRGEIAGDPGQDGHDGQDGHGCGVGQGGCCGECLRVQFQWAKCPELWMLITCQGLYPKLFWLLPDSLIALYPVLNGSIDLFH